VGKKEILPLFAPLEIVWKNPLVALPWKKILLTLMIVSSVVTEKKQILLTCSSSVGA